MFFFLTIRCEYMAESSYQERRRQLGGFQCASAAAVSQSVQAALLPYQTSVCVRWTEPTPEAENIGEDLNPSELF